MNVRKWKMSRIQRVQRQLSLDFKYRQELVPQWKIQTARQSEERVGLFSETSSYSERLRYLEVLYEISLFRGLNYSPVCLDRDS